MGVTNTTNYSLIKPNPGEERDAWGPYVNSNMDTIDTQLKSLSDSKAEKGSTNTFTADQVISVNSSGTALRITQTGAGNALVVEDSANPDATPFVVNANGEIGIGTGSPSVKLHIVGPDDIASSLIAGASKAIRIVPKSTHIQFEATDNTGVGSYQPLVIGGATLQFAIGASEKLSVNANGALGLNGPNFGTSGQVLISGGSSASPAWDTLGIAGGGTGATNDAGARANLGVPAIAANNTYTGIQYFNGGVGSNFSVLAEGGSEGGQFRLEKAPSGSTLAGSVVIDTATNVFRLYEDGGTYRGAYIELTAQAAAVGSKIFTTADIIPLANGGTGSGTAAGARTNLGLGTLATLNTAPVANGGTGATDAAGARTNLGLGSMATQASNSVSITGGSVTGITDLAIADGGTGASTAAGARTNLGLGALATLNTVGTTEIADLNVTTGKIADLNVTTAKIADSNVTTAKIADASITPAKMSGAQSGSAPAYAARAWVTFDGTVSTPTIAASGNVTSVTKNGTGDYTINFTTALPNANYAVSINGAASGGSGITGVVDTTTAPTTSAVRIQLSYFGWPASTAAANSIDSNRVSVVIFG